MMKNERRSVGAGKGSRGMPVDRVSGVIPTVTAVLPLAALDAASRTVADLREQVRRMEGENQELREQVKAFTEAELRRRRVDAITIRVVDNTAGCEARAGIRETERRTGSLMRVEGGAL